VLASRLPPEFADLDHYVDSWALNSEQDRFERRISSRLEDVKAFNDAMFERIDAVICYLNTQPLHSPEPQVVCLMNIAKAYMETSHPVDLLWKTTDLADAFPSVRFQFREPSC
jgi:hypothetical protein